MGLISQVFHRYGVRSQRAISSRPHDQLRRKLQQLLEKKELLSFKLKQLLMLNYYNPHSAIAMNLAGHLYLESSSITSKPGD